MRQGLKPQVLCGLRLPLRTHHHILALTRALRHALVWKVGDQVHRRVQACFHLPQLLLQFADPLVDAAHLFDQRLSFGCILQLADLIGGHIARVPQALQFLQDFPSLGVGRDDLVDRRLRMQLSDGGLHFFRILADELQIEHVAPP